MIEPWAKRMFFWAITAAVVHSAAWAWYLHQEQRFRNDRLQQRQGVIQKMAYSKFEKNGAFIRRGIRVIVTVTPLGNPQAAPQTFDSDASSDYIGLHKVGDVVPIWVKRPSGEIDDVVPPVPADLMRRFLILLSTLGLITAFLVFFVWCWRAADVPVAQGNPGLQE